MKNIQNGFSIVEIATVVVALGILVTIGVVSYNGVQQRSRDSKRTSDIGSIQKSLELYKKKNGSYPSCSGGAYVVGTPVQSMCYLPNANFTSALVPEFASSIPQDPRNTGTYRYGYVVGQSVSTSNCTATSNPQTVNYYITVAREADAVYCVSSNN